MRGRLILGLLVCWAAFAGAQEAAPDTTVGAAMRSLSSRAQDVFTGQVQSISHVGGVVEIRVRVDESLQGKQGGLYTLREWAGLWPPGQHRYFVGQRAMFFLRAPGVGGLASPVDDADGVVPMLPQDTGAAPVLDVRRLDARVLRAVGQPLADADHATVALSDARAVVLGWRALKWREPARYPLPRGARPLPTPAKLIAAPQRELEVLDQQPDHKLLPVLKEVLDAR